jgi:hypothetical protein
MQLEPPKETINGPEDIKSCAKTDRSQCETKTDDAEIPVFLWVQTLVPDQNPVGIKVLYHFRALGLRWWKQIEKISFNASSKNTLH